MTLSISIEKLISGNVVENQRIEYKKGWDPESILHSICAFANDFEGYSGGINKALKVNDRIISALNEKPMTMTEIARFLDYEIVPNSVKKAVSTLIKNDVIYRKNNKYYLK